MFYNININPYKITDFAQRKKTKEMYMLFTLFTVMIDFIEKQKSNHTK